MNQRESTRLRSEVQILKQTVAKLKADNRDLVSANFRIVLWLRKHRIRVPSTGELVRQFPKERLKWV